MHTLLQKVTTQGKTQYHAECNITIYRCKLWALKEHQVWWGNWWKIIEIDDRAYRLVVDFDKWFALRATVTPIVARVLWQTRSTYNSHEPPWDWLFIRVSRKLDGITIKVLNIQWSLNVAHLSTIIYNFKTIWMKSAIHTEHCLVKPGRKIKAWFATATAPENFKVWWSGSAVRRPVHFDLYLNVPQDHKFYL